MTASVEMTIPNVVQQIEDLHDSDVLGPLAGAWLTTYGDDLIERTSLYVTPYRYPASNPLSKSTAGLHADHPMHALADRANPHTMRAVDAYAVEQGWAHWQGRNLIGGPKKEA